MGVQLLVERALDHLENEGDGDAWCQRVELCIDAG
jgi:hypothetical protein